MERDFSTLCIKRGIYIHFNSHAHVERDVVTISSALKNGNFNSHAHVERDIAGVKLVNALYDFNSHAHVERDSI